jgi:sugar lactone lactonase YvrE
VNNLRGWRVLARMRLPFIACALAFSTPAVAHREGPVDPFTLAGDPIGDVKPAAAMPAYATSSRIVAIEGGALVIDADSGWLIRTDLAGAPLAHVAIGIEAGTLAYDPIGKRAYVADRRGDRIVVVTVGAELAIASSWATPAEPYGVALAPDRKTLLATMIADRAVVAYDAKTGKERWRTALEQEPRGIAISADGARAAIAMLSVGAIDEVELETHKLVRQAIHFDNGGVHADARGAFAVTYLGDHLLTTAFQLEKPNASTVSPDHYGGGFDPPIEHAVAFVDDRGKSVSGTTNINEPRAIAWDGAHDALYIVGMATDRIIQIQHGSQIDAHLGLSGSIGTRCGADGLAIDPDGNVLVWCSFPRLVVKIAIGERMVATPGPELVASNLEAKQHLGMVLFHTADSSISAEAGLSCGNCHLDGRSDGESWSIHSENLQTPMLAGRLVGTAPFKWDGGAKDLATSLRATVERLGGTGISQKHVTALVAFLESTQPVRTPTRDHAAVARGKALFDSAELGCTSCHDGPKYTDQLRHKFGGTAFDTPSLVGIAASAPYFHDGSAPTLDTLLRDHGGVHGMAGTESSALTEAQRADVAAFLETL